MGLRSLTSIPNSILDSTKLEKVKFIVGSSGNGFTPWVVFNHYLVQPYGIEKQVSDMDDSQVKVVGKDPDAIALYALLKNARSKDKVLAVLYAKSPLIPGTPREFLGSQKNTYTVDKAKRFGYAIPLAKLVRVFLGGGEEEPAGPADEPSGDGEFHGALQL